MKKEKGIKRATQQEEASKEEDTILKPAKKPKLVKAAQEPTKVVNKGKQNGVAVATVDTSIFQYFKDLTNEEEQKRMDAALKLLQQLSKSKETEKVG